MGHLTLGYLTMEQVPPLDMAAAAAAAGFKSAGLRITGRLQSDNSPNIVGNPPALRAIRSRFSECGVRLSNISTFHLRPGLSLAALLPVLDAAALIEAEMVVVSGYDPDRARMQDFISAYASAAAERNLKLALEFLPRSEIRTLEQGLEIAVRTGRKNVGLVIDALHLARSGGVPADLRMVDPNRIFFTQLCDASEKDLGDGASPARQFRLYPGEGVLPLYELLDALPPDIEIECETPRSDLAHLPAREQAISAMTAMRRFFSSYEQHKRTASRPPAGPKPM